MSKKKLIITLAVVGVVGAVATVAAQGYRERRMGGHDRFDHGGGMGSNMGLGMDQSDDQRSMRGGRGMFGRDLSKDAFDTRTREQFARLDKNGDGVLDAAEIEAASNERKGRMRERFAGGPQGGSGASGPSQQMLQRFGARDGKLTKAAFLDRMKARFAEADLNNDGRITDDDLPPMMRGRGMISTEALKGRGGPGRGLPMLGFLRDVEVKEGAITLEAVLVSATKEFDRLDRNKDGTVDQTDFDGLRKEMADYQVKRFIHQYGGDKDGKVTREQFYTKAAQRFAEADVNGDGRIGRDERGGRPGFSERMRDRYMGRGERGGPGGPGGQGGPPPKQ